MGVTITSVCWKKIYLPPCSESQNTINITKTGFLDKKAKKTFYQLPTVAYMNQAIKTLDELQKKTLSELGLRNGDNALLRVVYEVLDKTLEEMIPVLASYVPTQQQEPKTPKSATVPAQQQPEQTPVVQAEQQQQSPQDENMLATDDAIDAPAEDKMDIDEPQQQQAPPKEEKSHLFLPIEDDAVHIKLYKMVNPQFDPKELDIEESEFELTAAELKEYLASTEKKKEERETIKTEKFRVLDKQKQKKYPKALIRFRFPGGLIVQAAYNPSHTVAKLYTLIPKVMENAQTPFYLCTFFMVTILILIDIAPPVQRLDDCKEKTLGEMNLVPAAIVNVALDKKVAKPDDKDPAIHSQYLPLIQEANKEEIPKAISDTPAPEQDANKSSTNKQTSGGKKLGSTPTDSTDKKKKNIPKWLKPF